MTEADNRAQPSPEQLVAAARELVPLIRERAAEGERQRSVSPDIIAAMKDGGFFRILLPKRFGGYEYDVTTMVRCLFEWSTADASAAWVAGLAIGHQWMIALFPTACQEDVFGDDGNSITFGSYAPSGTCEAAEGGYRINGSWAYASGCEHGDWGLMGVTFPSRDDGEGKQGPTPGFVIVPKDDYVIGGVWDTMGLAATGSLDMICEDVFVPEHRTITFADLASGNSPGYQALGNPLYRYPVLAVIAYAISTPAVGCLAGALESFIAQTQDWETRGAVVRGGAKVIDFPAVHMRVGAAAGALKAAKAMLFEQLEDSRRRVLDDGELLSVGERLDNRLTQAYMVHLAVKGLDELWGATGGAGIQHDQYLQRAWRDVHAAAHHVSFNWDALTSMYGQYLLGLEPQGQY